MKFSELVCKSQWLIGAELQFGVNFPIEITEENLGELLNKYGDFALYSIVWSGTAATIII